MFAAMLAFRLAVGGTEPDPQGPVSETATFVERQDFALAQPQWIRHRVTPGELVVHTAVRFGVRPEDVERWNGLERGTRRVRPGATLRIEARRLPPPRHRVTHVVADGESWLDIAIEHRVDRRMLQAYNFRKKRLTPGQELTLWVDPGLPRTVNVRPGPEPPQVDLPRGALSVGRPQRGRILHAIQLPDSPLYTIRHPRWSWTTSHTARHIHDAIAGMRSRTGYAGEIVIGSISLEHGRRFPPHKSHQSGRDVDIRLPLLPGLDFRTTPRPEEVDWAATWELVRALADTGNVEVIFLAKTLHRRLYQAARMEGAADEDVAPLIQWVGRGPRKGALVRHARGHDGHIHVRIRCGPTEDRCTG